MSLTLKSGLLSTESEQDLHDNISTHHTISSSLSSFSNPQEENDLEIFPQRLYKRIEDFLDIQGLHICGQSPVLTHVTLKPSLDFKSLHKMSQLVSKKGDGNVLVLERSISQNKAFERKAIPKFLAKRTFSSEVNIAFDEI